MPFNCWGVQRTPLYPVRLDLGTVNGFPLHLIAKAEIEVAGSTNVYYFLDTNNNGAVEATDQINNHNMLDNLLNAGADTTNTERSVLVPNEETGIDYTIILPTYAELRDIPSIPSRWFNSDGYATSTVDSRGSDFHATIGISTNLGGNTNDNLPRRVAFQVVGERRPAP